MSNGQEDDEIEELPSKEQLERLKLQVEIARSEEERKKIELEREELERKSKLHWWKKPLFIQAIIAGIIAAPVLWFYVKDVALPLSSRENIKLSQELKKRNQELIKERKELDEMILQHKELQNQKILLEKETETLKLANAIIVERRKELEEEYAKLEEEVKSMSSFTNWYDKGMGEYYNKRYDEAVSSFSKALSKKSNDDSKAYALNFRGNAYRKLGEDEKALSDFGEATKLKPDNPLPYCNMAFTYVDLKDYKRAYKKYDEAMKLYITVGNNKSAHAFSRRMYLLFTQVEGEEEIKASIKEKTDELDLRLNGA